MSARATINNRSAVLAACLALQAFCAPGAQAAVSEGSDNQLDSGGANLGGGSTTGSTFTQSGAVGQTVGGGQLASENFRVSAGSLGARSTRSPVLPLSELNLAALYAKTEPAGSLIEQGAWQADNAPIFYWEPPEAAAPVAGYSYALDAVPDNTIDTLARSFDVATSALLTLADGRHTFSVRAVNSGGRGGPVSTFEIAVDTAPPSIAATSPAAGAILNMLTAPVAATITDAASGVDSSSLELLVNGIAAAASFNNATGMMSSSPSSWIQGSNRIELRVADAVGNNQTPLIWSVIMDTIPPAGTVAINANASVTSSVYVTLGLQAADLTSGVKSVLISNEPSSGYVEEPFVPLRALWRLSAVRGMQSVYVKYVDGAGNESAPVTDTIDLALTSPETLITGGPSGFTGADRATFAYLCPEGGCVFSYAVDHNTWSDWSDSGKMTTQTLAAGNHYFRVKAAKETNGVSGIQPDEEDPSPAERTWIVGMEPSIMAMPKGPAIKIWRIE